MIKKKLAENVERMKEVLQGPFDLARRDLELQKAEPSSTSENG